MNFIIDVEVPPDPPGQPEVIVEYFFVSNCLNPIRMECFGDDQCDFVKINLQSLEHTQVGSASGQKSLGPIN